MKRLLVIRFSALGDVAMLAPVVRATAEQYLDIEITVLSQKHMADLFANMPRNVLFHGVDLKYQSLHEIVSRIGRFDLVADMHGVWRSRYIRMVMRMHGSKVRIIHKGRFSRFLLTHHINNNALKHTSQRYADVMQSIGLPISVPFIPGRSYGEGIGIAPFAAHRGKMYSLKRMERVVELLSQRGENVVLFGSKEEAKVLDQWAEKYAGVECIAGRKSLSEELDIMRGLRVMVSMDSANMHLASLVGTRVLSIWGATHPKAGFLGIGQDENDCIQRHMNCRPCSIYGSKNCKYGDYRCLDIAPEEIVKQLA